MAVDVILTIASRGFRILGSGTRSTRTSFVACQTNAFIRSPLRRWRRGARTLVVIEDRLFAARLARDGRHLAGFHQLLEPPQVFADCRRGIVAEHPRDGRADLAGRRVVLHPHAYFGPAPGGEGREAHRSGIDDVGAGEGAPGNHFTRDLVDDLGLPLDGPAAGRLHDPARAPVVDLGN